MPEKPGKFRPSLFGGVIMGVLSVIPMVSSLNCVCCAWVLLGGALSVFFYSKDVTPSMSPLTNGDAVQLGALSGLFGAIVAGILSFFSMVVFQFNTMNVDQWNEMMEKVPAESQAILESLQWIVTSPALLAVIAFVAYLVIFPIFGLLGGLIGFALFKPKAPLVPPQPPAAPIAGS